jgi:hypothetical protein
MIDCAWILNAHLPWHQSILPQTTEAGKDKIEHIHGLTPLMVYTFPTGWPHLTMAHAPKCGTHLN